MNDDVKFDQMADQVVTLPAAEVSRLYDTERRLMTLLGNLPGMAYRCRNDSAWTMEFVSPGCSELTGYAATDLTQGRVTYAELVCPEERERVWDDVQRAVKDRVPFQLTYRITTASGEVRWVWEQGEGVYVSDGEIEGIEGFITDVTARVQAHEKLEELVRTRTRELMTLLDISRSVVLTVELEPLLEAVFTQLSLLIDNESISIGLVDGRTLTIVASRRGEIGSRFPSSIGMQFDVDRDSSVWGKLANGETVYSPNVHGDDPVAIAYRKRVGTRLPTMYAHVCSWIATPLVVKGHFIGCLFLSSPEENHYSPHEIELLSASANQVAVAIQNAQLHERSREFAVLEERQRLARELHDSVSQALYGIGLGARTARALIDSDPARAVGPLDYVLELAEAGMAEMRALIFELRPESLATEGVVEALRKQAAALKARYRLNVVTQLDSEPDVSVEAKEALYRIAQEAMHNVIKHAQASVIDVRLACRNGDVLLEIADDGNGFDTNGSFPGHLGLTSMRERAEQLGGIVIVESSPGCGTLVQVRITNVL